MDTQENVALRYETEAEPNAKPTLSATRRMDLSLLNSVVWNTASDWTGQLLKWAAFMLVLRFVGPTDFGLVAMTVVLLPLVYTSTFGIGRAVVTLRDFTNDQLAQLNTLSLLLGIASFGIATALSQPIAWFFKTPRLGPVIIVSSIGFIVTGAQLVGNGIMMKEMRFRALSVLNAASAVAASALQLLLAWLGWGYWALVIGTLALVFFRGAPVLFLQPLAYAFPRWSSVRRAVVFGGHVVISLLTADVYESLDNFIAGRVLGPASLGLYGIAWTLAHVPVEKVTTMVTTVISSYLSALQNDLAAVRRYLRKLTEGIALVTFPACVGLGIVAPEFVLVVLGRKWEGAVGPLRVLSIYAGFRSIVALLPKILTSLNDPRFVMWNSLATLVVLGPAFYVGSHWGITGIAWAWVAAYPWVVIFLYREVFTKIKMRVGEYIGSLRPALEGTIAMTIAVECCGFAISNRSLVLRLAVKIVVGIVAYAGIVWLRHKQRVLAFVDLAKTFRSG